VDNALISRIAILSDVLSVGDALRKLAQLQASGDLNTNTLHFTGNLNNHQKNSSLLLNKIYELCNPQLISYLTNVRKIDLKISKVYCKQASFTRQASNQKQEAVA